MVLRVNITSRYQSPILSQYLSLRQGVYNANLNTANPPHPHH